MSAADVRWFLITLQVYEDYNPKSWTNEIGVFSSLSTPVHELHKCTYVQRHAPQITQFNGNNWNIVE